MELGPKDVSPLERCPYFRGLGPENVSLLERCPHFRGCYVQASMELGPEDVSLLEKCPHFRGCYVQASMELGPEDVSLLERCPYFRGCYICQWSWDLIPGITYTTHLSHDLILHHKTSNCIIKESHIH